MSPSDRLPDKKTLKSQAKHAKKAAKLEHKKAKGTASGGTATRGPSPAVRYAEVVRGGLSIVVGLSIVAALVLGQRGAIMSVNDIIDNLFAAWTGKILLALIAVGMIIYGLKYLRLVR